MANAKRFKEEYDDQGRWMGHPVARWLKPLCAQATDDKMVAYHDPAMAENKESDYAAIVVGARDIHGYIYCLDAFIEKIPPSKQIEQAYAFNVNGGFATCTLRQTIFRAFSRINIVNINLKTHP